MIITIPLHPSRIGCPSISGTMKGIIMSVNGVRDVVVRYDDRSVDVTFEDKETSIARIIKAVGDEMGLSLEVAKSGGSPASSDVAETCPM